MTKGQQEAATAPVAVKSHQKLLTAFCSHKIAQHTGLRMVSASHVLMEHLHQEATWLGGSNPASYFRIVQQSCQATLQLSSYGFLLCNESDHLAVKHPGRRESWLFVGVL